MSKAIAELARIQQELKAPKNQFNKFGNYRYRSGEDILEGVKKVLKGCSIVISDEIVCVESRHYIKAVARLIAPDGSTVESTAYAREAENKKGMDEAQVSGSTSSYARKYALNGLFAIDDTKDSDHDGTPEKPPKKAEPAKPAKEPAKAAVKEAKAGAAHIKVMKGLIEQILREKDDFDENRLRSGIQKVTNNRASTLAEMTVSEAEKFTKQLNKILQ